MENNQVDKLSSTRPYLTRALYEWMEDNGLTSYVLVDSTQSFVEVPRQYVKDGRIVLNISSSAVRDLFISNEAITFSARFGGVPMNIHVPMESLLAIYARENGKGMFFEQEEGVESTQPSESPKHESEKKAQDKSRPSLKVVK